MTSAHPTTPLASSSHSSSRSTNPPPSCTSPATPARSRSPMSGERSTPRSRRWSASLAPPAARSRSSTRRCSTNGSTEPERLQMTAIIEIEQLTKSYGKHRGIIDIDLTVDQGEAFGFLGPNGAGKTTTIRTLLDHLRPTSGQAKVFGIVTSEDPVAIHRRVGYLPGEFALYDKLTGAQTIDYFANL